jgi:hypothetical protein
VGSYCSRELLLSHRSLLSVSGYKPDVHGWHAHEHAGCETTIACYVFPNVKRVELGKHLDAGAGYERTEERVHQAMYMVQRQAVEDNVVR